MVKNTSDITGCAERLDVQDYEINSVEKCASGVKAKSECSDKFFYAPLRGWCKCEGNKGSCARKDSADFNEYRLTGALLDLL